MLWRNVKMRNETKQSMMISLQNGQKYDESCKEVFRNREVIAPILKYVVDEFRDCTLEEIIKCIDADSIAEDIPVDELPPGWKDLGTEMTSVYEKTIHYDVHFKAQNPKLSNNNFKVMLRVDFEVQNRYRSMRPRYPLIKRAIYYVAREISSQLGKLTGRTNYADIEKAYSIWVCNEEVPKKLQNTVTRYYFTKEDIVGKMDEPEKDYDLMEVIIIRRGKEAADDDIFRYLEAVFTSDLNTMREYIDIPEGSEIEKEVEDMNGMWRMAYRNGMEKGIEDGLEQGIEQGIKQGREQGLSQGMEQGKRMGEELLSSLMKKLFADGRTADAELVLSDEELRKKFYREYGLVD